MIPPVLIDKVLVQARQNASHSWEYGTVFEALLEYRDSQVSVFHCPFPGGEIPQLKIEDVEALRYVMPFIQTDSTRLCEGNGKSSSPRHHQRAMREDDRLTAFDQVHLPIQHSSAFPPCCCTNQ
jgi:hypothetical protein